MRIVKTKIKCSVCGKNDAVVYCDGCDAPLCGNCRKFDLWGYGCGHVDTKAFCLSCADDIEVNPWGGKRPAAETAERTVQESMRVQIKEAP